MQTQTTTQNKCYISFWEELNERLRDPEYKKGFEKAQDKVHLQVMINCIFPKVVTVFFSFFRALFSAIVCK